MFTVHKEGLPFIEILCVDSSNNYAMGWINEGLANHQMSFFTYYQSAGKGQTGKMWQSTPGKNILLTTILDANGIALSSQPVFNMAVALAIQEFYQSFVTEPVKLKWPNDVYVNDKKAAGILIENRIKGNRWQWAVVGMGININQDSFPDTSNATSLKILTGKEFVPVQLAKQLLPAVFRYFERLKAGEEEELFQLYNSKLYKLGSEIKLENDQTTIHGLLQGVDKRGRLIVNTNCAEKRISHGEARWIIA